MVGEKAHRAASKLDQRCMLNMIMLAHSSVAKSDLYYVAISSYLKALFRKL